VLKRFLIVIILR